MRKWNTLERAAHGEAHLGGHGGMTAAAAACTGESGGQRWRKWVGWVLKEQARL